MPKSGVARQTRSGALTHISFLPVPALIVAIAVMYFAVEPTVFFEPKWLLPITNTLFVTLVCLIVAYIAMRNYQATGRIQILLLGCGLLSFGMGGVIAGWLRSVPGNGANLNVTIYNTAALLGGVFHFAAALMVLASVSPEIGYKRKGMWLGLGYVGSAAFIGLFTMASVKGMVAPFFIQGVGPTLLRQWVLGLADVLFVFSFLVFMGSYLKNREAFLYWYSSALALTAISLTAFFIQRSVGSPIGWAGRTSQYVGGVYFVVAVVTAVRSAQARRTSIDNVITTALSPSEEKFRALAENSPDIIERFDRELRHLYVNRAGVRAFGKAAGSIVGQPVEALDLPETYCRVLREKIHEVFEAGQRAELEAYLPTVGGVEFYEAHCFPEYDRDGSVANVTVVSHNLTERKRAEEEISRRNRILDGINAIFRDVLSCETDQDLGKTCLQVAEEITGSKFGFIGEIGSDGLLHDIAISETGWELCPIDQQGHRKPPGKFAPDGLYGVVFRDGKSLLSNAPAEHPASIGTPPGHPQLTAFLGVPLLDDGRTLGMIGVGNRQGGYRQEDQEALEALAPAIVEALRRKRAEQALVRSEKLVSVGRLAATMAHEINNPLAGAINALYLVTRDSSLSPSARTLAELAEREVRRAGETARRILGFCREPNVSVPVAMSELCSDLAGLYGPQMNNKGVHLRVLCTAGAATVMGNTGELRQLFSNLLANSLDAVSKSGIVYLRVRRSSEGRTPFVRVTVADTGAGIDVQNIRKVFEPFFTTKKEVGTGLGLWISEQIVRKHGGVIRVRSRVGRGTVFCVKLPAASEGAAAVAGSQQLVASS